MLSHRYGLPIRDPASRHPAAEWYRAALCQCAFAPGRRPGPGAGRDGHLESVGPDAFAAGAFAGTEAGARPGGWAAEEGAAVGGQAMMGRRSPQGRVFAADQIYLDHVGRDTIYGYLAQHREHLFRDEDFAALYCADNGRTSVPPSLAVSMLFLRAYERVSLAEAAERAKYDLRWKVALGLEMEEGPIQKSALQEFEAQLVLHKMGEALLKKSIEEARRAGYLPQRKIRVALDTTPILGKGAVKDTYNLLAEGIVKLGAVGGSGRGGGHGLGSQARVEPLLGEQYQGRSRDRLGQQGATGAVVDADCGGTGDGS